MRRAPLIALVLLLGGCQQKTPTRAVPIEGKEVNWGQGFGTQQPAMAPQKPALPTTPEAQPTGSGTDWSGGDAKLGENLFGNTCARCHGLQARGGNLPGMGPVPDLTTAEMHTRLTEADVANIIAHGRGRMPANPNLDGNQIRALVAYVKSLQK